MTEAREDNAYRSPHAILVGFLEFVNNGKWNGEIARDYLVYFFARTYKNQHTTYSDMYRALTEMLPRAQWTEGIFQWGPYPWNIDEVASYEEFRNKYLIPLFGGLFDAYEFLKEYENDLKGGAKKLKTLELRKHEGDRKSKEFKQNEVSVTTFSGREKQYLLTRLDRDHPKLAKRVRAGKLSVNAAAVKAGFRTETITIPLDPQRAAKALLKTFDESQLHHIVHDVLSGLQKRAVER